MSILDNNIALRRTVEDYAEARDEAIASYISAHRQIERMKADLAKLGDLLCPYNARFELEPEDFTKALDQRLWQLVFDKTEIPRYMDAKARADFNRSLEHDPVPFTVENVRSTLVSAASQVDEMFARGLYELFCSRASHLTTNSREPFKLPRKIIWSYMVASEWVRWNGLRISHAVEPKINDLDRVLRTLAGEDFTPHSLSTKINSAWQTGDTFEDDLLKVRGFRNGNIHVWIKRQDVIDKANRVIAEYAGPALAADRRAA